MGESHARALFLAAERLEAARAQAENEALLAGIRRREGDALGRFTAETIARLRTSPEGQEGLRAFLKKRAPGWLTYPPARLP